MQPETIVWKQLEAYNARNIDLFASTFSSTIELYNFEESQPFLKGRDELREVYEDVFDKSPKLNAVLVNKMVLGNKVIYHEKVTGRLDEVVEVIAMYEVKDNLISCLTFMRK